MYYHEKPCFNFRFIVRIDHWESGSQYPNGHFVRSLGQIGDLETEIKAILVENDISVPPFSEAQVTSRALAHWGLVEIDGLLVHRVQSKRRTTGRNAGSALF